METSLATGCYRLKHDPSNHIYKLQTIRGEQWNFEKTLRHLEYAFAYLKQASYKIMGPNSNTYAHVLLVLAGMEFVPFEETRLYYEGWVAAKVGIPIERTVRVTQPEGAVGWDYRGTPYFAAQGWVPHSLEVPENFQVNVDEIVRSRRVLSPAMTPRLDLPKPAQPLPMNPVICPPPRPRPCPRPKPVLPCLE